MALRIVIRGIFNVLLFMGSGHKNVSRVTKGCKCLGFTCPTLSCEVQNRAFEDLYNHWTARKL